RHRGMSKRDEETIQIIRDYANDSGDPVEVLLLALIQLARASGIQLDSVHTPEHIALVAVSTALCEMAATEKIPKACSPLKIEDLKQAIKDNTH
ncbi:hypothetical protein ACFL0S_13805, partial [Thermodesulfobacteriota bacterium]